MFRDQFGNLVGREGLIEWVKNFVKTYNKEPDELHLTAEQLRDLTKLSIMELGDCKKRPLSIGVFLGMTVVLDPNGPFLS